MRSEEIFNYVQLSEDHATSGQPVQDEFEAIAKAGYQAVVNIAMPDSEEAIPNEGSLVTSLGLSYFHIPVPFEAPTAQHLRLFIKLMETLKGQKVWIHCALNYRVSAFMYQYQRLVCGASSEEAKSPIFELWHPDEAWDALMKLDADEIGL